MSSKRRLRRKACTGKRQFADEAAAIAAIKSLTRSQGWQGLLVPYHCKFCGWFHFGHAPANVRRRF
jgi:predicted Zn-ribbon and HTH transcriptional regulator